MLYVIPGTDLKGVNPKEVFLQGLETNFIIKNPLVTSGRISIRANAVIFQNAGNCNVELNNGFTLLPQQSIMIGNYNEINTIKIDLSAKFLPATNTSGNPLEQRLEICEIETSIAGKGLYIDQPSN